MFERQQDDQLLPIIDKIEEVSCSNCALRGFVRRDLFVVSLISIEKLMSLRKKGNRNQTHYAEKSGSYCGSLHMRQLIDHVELDNGSQKSSNSNPDEGN